MRRSRRSAFAILSLVFVALSMLPLASALDAASPVQSAILELFFIILILSLIVGVLVHVILLLAVKWYRDTPRWRPPAGHPRTHDGRLEVGWTIGPVVILAAVAILTMAALGSIERPPAYDYRVKVIAAQWVWLFEYPDWNETAKDLRSSGKMYIQEGKTFLLEVTSLDVIHSFYVPDLGIKIDAVPGITNIFWVRGDRAGVYSVQCAEFCGAGHSQMHGEVVVFPAGAQEIPYGPPPVAAPPPTTIETGLIVPVEFLESPGPYGRWSINPSRLQFGQGIKITLRVYNNQTSPHQFRIAPPYDITGGVESPGGPPFDITFWTNTTTEGIQYWCDISGHKDLGMLGILNVTGPRDQEILITAAGVQPARLDMGPGQTLAITVRNQDTAPHDFLIGPPYSVSFGTVSAGGSASRTVTFNTTTRTTYGDPADTRFAGDLVVSPVGVVEAVPPVPTGVPVVEVTFTLLGFAGAAAVWLNVKLAREAKRRDEIPPDEEFE